MCWIRYSDSEVSVFHPIAQSALNYALIRLHISDRYQVLHHQWTSSLEMDFAIRNIETGNYLCVIEIKRRPSDVNSARYQHQAMSYVQENANRSERPFYILTNLEYSRCFRYDSNRPRVVQQMLEPGLELIGDFNTYTRDTFIEVLTQYFQQKIESFLNNTYRYMQSLYEFEEHMEYVYNQHSIEEWNTHLAILLYEYINGAISVERHESLRDINSFRHRLSEICREAARINFHDIFNYSNERFSSRWPDFERELLNNMLQFGRTETTGETVSDIIHGIVSSGNEHNGEVATDAELARIVSILALYAYGNRVSNEDRVCDPAAGSGNLLSAAIDIML